MKNQDYSKKILKILSESKAVTLPDLTDSILAASVKDSGEQQKDILRDTPAHSAKGFVGPRKGSQTVQYAINRSLKGLIDSGYIESHFSGQNNYARLSKSGRRKATSLKLESETALLNPNWDGQWRIVLLDLPESRKSEREALRYLLKKAGFVILKNSAWISPFPFEHLFMNMKKDLELTTEMMIIVTNTLDAETEAELFKTFKK